MTPSMSISLRQSVIALLRESPAGSSAASRPAALPSPRWAPARAGAAALAGAALLAAPGLQAAGPAESFAAPTVHDTASKPVAVVLGDVDGDGDLDMVTANSTANSVSVLLGNGSGGFATKQDYSTGTFPYSVALGDVNGDGKLDVVTANQDSSNVSVLIGIGAGAFSTPTNFATDIGPLSVALGYVNDDRYLDVVTANFGIFNGTASSTASVLLGNGDGTFAAKQDFATGNRPASVALGDVNGDGKLDLVTANYGDTPAGNTASVLLGNGDGNFATKQDYGTGLNPISVALGDVNRDGKLDLVTANLGSDTASVLLGNGDGDGTFATQIPAAVGDGPASVALGDVNSDGKLDLITSNVLDSTVSVLRGNEDGTFATQTPLPATTGAWPRSVALGDVNGDRQTDLVAANRDINQAWLWLNTTTLTETDKSPPALSFENDTLRITPPPAATCDSSALTQYVIHYNTPTRIANGEAWGIWARKWPVAGEKLALDLDVTRTAAGCVSFAGGPPTQCGRPAVIGLHDPNETYVYRVFGGCTSAPLWSFPSFNLVVTRHGTGP